MKAGRCLAAAQLLSPCSKAAHPPATAGGTDLFQVEKGQQHRLGVAALKTIMSAHMMGRDLWFGLVCT